MNSKIKIGLGVTGSVVAIFAIAYYFEYQRFFGKDQSPGEKDTKKRG